MKYTLLGMAGSLLVLAAGLVLADFLALRHKRRLWQ